jgi:hypothetical protein
MSAALARIVREEKIDVIHAHCLHVGQYVNERGTAAFVYDAHNLEHVLWARFARVQPPLRRAFVKNQIPKFVSGSDMSGATPRRWSCCPKMIAPSS